MQPSEATGGKHAAMEQELISQWSEGIRHRSAPRMKLVRRVAEALRDQIESGRLKPGTKLANEVALAQALEISRPTLREAIRVLAREGLLRVKHGVGTFVAEEKRVVLSRLDAIRSMTDLIRSVGGTPGDADLRIELVEAPAEVTAALELRPGALVGSVSRVRLIDGRPLALAMEYLALADVEADFVRLQAFGGGSLYDFLRRSRGIALSHSSLTIAAVPAAPAQAKRLALRPGTPLLRLRETHFEAEGKPILFTVNFLNSEIVELTVPRAGWQT